MIKVSMEQTTYTVPRECVSRVATLYLLVGMTRRICNKKKGGGVALSVKDCAECECL